MVLFSGASINSFFNILINIIDVVVEIDSDGGSEITVVMMMMIIAEVRDGGLATFLMMMSGLQGDRRQPR